MINHFYRVIEDRILLNGNHSPVVQHYDHDETITDPETGVTHTLTAYDQAVARYHTIAAAAAVSVLPYHSVVLEQETGIQIEKPLVWDRRTDTPEPQPEEAAPAEEEANETA